MRAVTQILQGTRHGGSCGAPLVLLILPLVLLITCFSYSPSYSTLPVTLCPDRCIVACDMLAVPHRLIVVSFCSVPPPHAPSKSCPMTRCAVRGGTVENLWPPWQRGLLLQAVSEHGSSRAIFICGRPCKKTRPSEMDIYPY